MTGLDAFWVHAWWTKIRNAGLFIALFIGFFISAGLEAYGLSAYVTLWLIICALWVLFIALVDSRDARQCRSSSSDQILFSLLSSHLTKKEIRRRVKRIKESAGKQEHQRIPWPEVCFWLFILGALYVFPFIAFATIALYLSIALIKNTLHRRSVLRNILLMRSTDFNSLIGKIFAEESESSITVFFWALKQDADCFSRLEMLATKNTHKKSPERA